jgi:hypothetical protein
MTTLHDAVYSVYSNAGVTSGNDIDSLVVLDKDHQPMTIDLDKITAKLVELQAAETAAEQAKVDAKASALAKLAALGLTQDEVKALVG